MSRDIKAVDEGRAITRRGFIEIAVGSVMLLPSVASAALLSTEIALAEEAAEVVDAAEVYVVKRSEVALVVRDVSKSDDAGNVLVGAQVKLTSRFNGASLEGTTDGRGGVLFDIAKLAEDGGKGEKPARYAFNGTIIMSKD